MFDQLQMKMAFKLSVRLRFYRTMSRQTDSRRRGVTPIRALQSMIRNEEIDGRKTALSKLYRHIKNRLELGKRVGEVLQSYAPASEASQIYAAEISGRVSDGFIMAAEVAKQQATFQKVFREALIGPSINLVLSLGIIYMFFTTLVPAMTGALNVEKMSVYSSILVMIADHFLMYLMMTVSLIILLIAWIIWALPRYNGVLRLKLEKIPPFSMYKIMVGCSFLYAYNSLVKTGTQQVVALWTIRQFATPYLKFRINKILEQTSKGFGEALLNMRMNFPDKEVLNEMAMASEHGVLNEAMPDIVENLSIDGLELIKLQAQVAKTIAMILVVGAIMFLITGTFSFMADMQAMTGI
mgnify:CR=1 FL=1